MTEISFADAIRRALQEEMRADPNVLMWGEDIGRFGGIMRTTRDLVDEFGESRVRDTPVSEAAIATFAVGAAMAGVRPVVEIMFGGLLPLVAEALLNQAAKTRYRTGGQWNVPMVLRVRSGPAAGAAPVSAETYDNAFVGVPGLIVVAPSTPRDARRMMRAAIRSNDPVLFLEHVLLYKAKGEVPDEEEIGRLSESHIVRKGTAATVVATMAMVPVALAAADRLSAEGTEIEVVDPCTLYPLDIETIAASVRSTSKLVTLQDTPVFGGLTAEIVAQLQARGELATPALRIGTPAIPLPQAPHLGRSVLPSVESVAEGLRAFVAA